MYTRAVDRYSQERKQSITSCCELLGLSRQFYYSKKWSTAKSQQRAKKVVDLVLDVRKQLTRTGTRKLYFMLEEPLGKLHLGRDKLFPL